MIQETIPQIARLSPREKLTLAGELWDEVTAIDELFPVCPEIVNLLEARYTDYVRNPAGAKSWDEVNSSLRKRHEV
jgi:putative addiction module component (TIGR02574 family)